MSTPLQAPALEPTIPRDEESPQKRLRTDKNVRLLPKLYQHCDTKDLVVLIADMLGELVGFNDRIPLHTGGLTRFHSRYGAACPSSHIPLYTYCLVVLQFAS